MKSQTKMEFNNSEMNGNDLLQSKPRQSSQTPEYVKRTAKLFESIKITETTETINGIERKTTLEQKEIYSNKPGQEISVKLSLDSIDGEINKKPSYLGVSCSNSGYRNVINYDSKLREGFCSANNHRESLVLSSSRLRENSPMRRDLELVSQNGSNGDSVNITKVIVEKDKSVPANGVDHTEKFVNISTSTKTISTFRNSKDLQLLDVENLKNWENVDCDSKASGNNNVNLKQILNGKTEDRHRRGYSNLGFSPKILKSPEKNCNSFLKSISSFENNCKNSETLRTSRYSRTEQSTSNSPNSIQQRIERLYGPGALAQAFYSQKTPTSKTNPSDKVEDVSTER